MKYVCNSEPENHAERVYIRIALVECVIIIIIIISSSSSSGGTRQMPDATLLSALIDNSSVLYASAVVACGRLCIIVVDTC